MSDPLKIGGARPLNEVPQRQEQDRMIRDAAQMYEKHFLREMVKAMRSTVKEGEGYLKPNFGQKLYQEHLDNEYVEVWGSTGGIGLSDVIYNQIKERYFPEGGAPGVPQGPLPLQHMHELKKDEGVRTFMNVPSASQQKGAAFRFALPPGQVGEQRPVVNPWDGQVLAAFRDADNRQVLRVKHGSELQSLIAFRGSAATGLKVGDQLQAGQELGQLYPDSREVLWQLN